MYTKALREACATEGKHSQLSEADNGMTIGRVAREHPTGAWIIAVKGHAICLKDGALHDWTADTAGRRKIGYRAGMEGAPKGNFGVARIG